MTSAVRNALRNRARHWEAEPADLNLEDLDLEAAGPFSSVLIDFRDHFIFTIWSDVTDVAATTGDFDVVLDLYARDGTTLIETVTLFSAQGSDTTNQVKLTFGAGVDADLQGTATIGTALAGLKEIFLGIIRVVINTQADGASTLSIRMQSGD